MMRTRKKIKAGLSGTKKLVEKYGNKLLCVRYIYDEENKKRYKTAEIIIDVAPWEPKVAELKPVEQVCGLQIGKDETEIKRLVKAAGGKWHPGRNVWKLPYSVVVGLNLETRIVE